MDFRDKSEKKLFREAQAKFAALGIAIKYNSEWEEYTVRPRGASKDATYHASDLDDAIAAAQGFAGMQRQNPRTRRRNGSYFTEGDTVMFKGSTAEGGVQLVVINADRQSDGSPGMQLRPIFGPHQDMEFDVAYGDVVKAHSLRMAAAACGQRENPRRGRNPQVGDYELTLDRTHLYEGRKSGHFTWKKTGGVGRTAQGGTFTGYLDPSTQRFKKYASGGYGGGMNPPEAIKRAAEKILKQS